MDSTEGTATRIEQAPIFLPNSNVVSSPGSNSVSRQSDERSLRDGFSQVLLCFV
jgi:hypothetical protein